MSRPDFTSDELYLINAVRSRKASAASNTWMWGYLTGGLVLAGLAAYYGSIEMLISAFFVLCGFRIYEEYNNVKWVPAWRSVLEKYEAAVAAAEASESADT